jgi:hypothetical protein
VELLGRGISPSENRYLHKEQHKQNKRTQTSMHSVGFEPTIPAFERAKAIYASDRAATVIGNEIYTSTYSALIVESDGNTHAPYTEDAWFRSRFRDGLRDASVMWYSSVRPDKSRDRTLR